MTSYGIRAAALVSALLIAFAQPDCAFAQDGMLPAKEPGVIRIGIVKPKVKSSFADPSQVAEAVRNTFAEYLGGPTQEVVLLTSRATSQVKEEARLAECDYVLISTLTHKRGDTGGSLFGQALSEVAGTAGAYIPTNPIASAAVSSAMRTAADYATIVMARDELRLEYSLQVPGARSAVLKKSQKAQAEADGHDVLT